MVEERWDGVARRALPWLLALALILRLQGLGWDGFAGLHPDEGNLVRGALFLQQTGGLVPEFHAYNGLSLWVPLGVASLACPGQTDIACMTWAARLVSALYGALAVAAGAGIAGRLGGPTAAALAAVTLGLSAPLIQWSHFGTTESGLVLALMLLWLLAVRYLDRPGQPLRHALAMGAVLGFALGLKTTGAVLALLPLVALALGPAPLAPRRLLALAAGAGLAVAILLASTPAILLDTGAYLQTMRFERGVVAGTEDVFWTWQFAGRTAGLYELAQLWMMTEGVGLVLALVGAVWLLRGPNARGGLPAILVALVYLALICTWHARFARYLAPVIPVVMLLAALAAAWLLRAGETARVACLAGLALIAVNGLSLALGHRATDPRVAAAADLGRRALAEDTVLVEPRDVGAQLLVGLRLAVIAPDAQAGAAELAQALAGGRWLVIFSRRNWAVMPRLPERFPLACAYYAGLSSGDFGYRVVARHRRAAPLGRLLAPGLAAEETRSVFDRPEVFLLERTREVPAEEIAARLQVPADPSSCSPAAIGAALERVL